MDDTLCLCSMFVLFCVLSFGLLGFVLVLFPVLNCGSFVISFLFRINGEQDLNAVKN